MCKIGAGQVELVPRLQADMSRPHTHAGTRALTNGPHQSNRAGQTSLELVKAVRQLVGVAVGYLNSHPQCSCEEALAQLPTTDEHFHWSVQPQ